MKQALIVRFGPVGISSDILLQKADSLLDFLNATVS
jgi:hypothetical protein